MKHSYKYNHICKNCGKEFVGSRGVSYCSSECRREAKRKRSKSSLTADEKERAVLFMLCLDSFKKDMQGDRKISINLSNLRSWWSLARESKVIILG